jgi:hypothetical protein
MQDGAVAEGDTLFAYFLRSALSDADLSVSF